MDPKATARAVVAGDVRVAARVMRALDDGSPDAIDVLAALYPHTGKAHVVGITGNPGSGKSTLVSALIGALRRRGQTVGVLAIDPSSPFSGGALLGDRVRMMEHAADEGVFIRSLATRGALGGLSRSTGDMVHVLDAMGLDVILVETVGVGQDEIDVVRMARTTVVVLVPGMGDDIQAIKAGILEIADLFVINKADRPGADRTAADLGAMQSLAAHLPGWQPPILRAVATRGEGVDALLDTIAKHHSEGLADAPEQLRQRAQFAIETRIRDHWGGAASRWLQQTDEGTSLVADVAARRLDPYTAVRRTSAALQPGPDRDTQTGS